MIRSLFRLTFLALAFGAAAPAHTQGYALIGTWRCHGPQVVYDMVFNADGRYSGIYVTANDYRAYSEGPYRLQGSLLRIDFHVWETQPQQTPTPGGETFSVQFRGGAAMSLLPTRCPQGTECRFSCERHR